MTDPKTRPAPRPAFPANSGLLEPRLGRALVRIGLAGLILAVVASAIAWLLVDGSIDSLEDSLEVTDESVVAVAETIDVLEDALGDAGDGLTSLSTATEDSQQALAVTAQTLEAADTVLAESVPEGIEAIRGPLPGLITSSELLSGVLSGLSFLGLDYQPDPAPEDSLRAIDTALAELADRLRDPDTRLTGVASEISGVAGEFEDIDARVSDLAASVERAEVVLASYEAATERAASLVDQTKSDLAGRRILARTLVIVLGVIVVAGQAVPILLGRAIAEAGRRPDYTLDVSSRDVSARGVAGSPPP